MLSHSSNISNTSEAYTAGPKSEIKLMLPMNQKYTTRGSSCEKPVIGIRHQQHCVLLVQGSRCRPFHLAEMCSIGERLVPEY